MWNPDIFGWWGYGYGHPESCSDTPQVTVATEWVNGPDLDTLKSLFAVPDTRDDAALQLFLNAATKFVMRVRASDLNFDADLTNPNPAPGDDFLLGTYMLAYRWFTRRRSPDGIVQMGDLGTGRVPRVDADIARLLGIDQFSGPVIA